ncbi:MAG: low specificity L-threonine aldolase [Desulfobacteraceae bacterium]|nr:MAG: low specificity L-threonine aldolase [Desulfobacteraceae bacterium]
MRGFASDNISGVHPAVMNAIQAVNIDHAHPYGDDQYTTKAINHFKSVLKEDIDVLFTFNGTGANVLALSSMAQSFHAVICAECAHINKDECGAPEKFVGCKLFALPSDRGKIRADQLSPLLKHIGFEHHNQPRVISITQPTEFGALYQPHEIREIAEFAKKHHMTLHMDGARIGNACAAMDMGLMEMTGDLGVDVLSFGGTKNGAMYGEAVIFFNRSLAAPAKFIRKQSMQLGSKMRFIAAQFDALLTDDLWLKNADQANQMAQALYERLSDIPCVDVTGTVDTNAVFAIIPSHIIERLQEKTFFYIWDDARSQVRLMTSFDTTMADVEAFAELVRIESQKQEQDQ